TVACPLPAVAETFWGAWGRVAAEVATIVAVYSRATKSYHCEDSVPGSSMVMTYSALSSGRGVMLIGPHLLSQEVMSPMKQENASSVISMVSPTLTLKVAPPLPQMSVEAS